VGQHADLLVVEGDPLASIGSLRDPAIVLRAGVPVRPVDPAYTAATP
jgi:imidazolonepropionase-like amidohydrolase